MLLSVTLEYSRSFNATKALIVRVTLLVSLYKLPIILANFFDNGAVSSLIADFILPLKPAVVASAGSADPALPALR